MTIFLDVTIIDPLCVTINFWLGRRIWLCRSKPAPTCIHEYRVSSGSLSLDSVKVPQEKANSNRIQVKNFIGSTDANKNSVKIFEK